MRGRSILASWIVFVALLVHPGNGAYALASPVKQSSVDQQIDAPLDKLAREVIPNGLQRKRKIAVIEFPDMNGRVTNLGKFVAEELTTRLFATGRVEVIERHLINTVLKEQKLGMLGVLDEKSTKKVGAILGVDLLVTGTIADLGTTMKINARTIAVETGAVYSAVSAALPKSDQIRKLAESEGPDRGESASADAEPSKPFAPPAKPAADPTPRSGGAGKDIVITGRLFFDGKPLSEYTKATATFRVYSRDLNQWITPAYEYDPETAAFTLQVIAEGSYSCNVEVDANGANPERYPGDYKGSGHFSAWFTSAQSLKIDMDRIIHLVEPQNNDKPVVGWGAWCFNKVQFKTPVRVSWEPVERDVYYTYTVNRTICSPFSEKELVAGDTTTATSVILDLPPNREGEIYLMNITARKNGRSVGSIMVHGGNGYGWDYRFRAVK